MGNSPYFCLKINDFVIDDSVNEQVIEKCRSGWKKGDPDYESHRRKVRGEKSPEPSIRK
jgi:hypothetical protein